MQQAPNFFAPFAFALLPMLVIIAVLIVNISFTIGVVIAIRKLREGGRHPWFVGPEIWGLATLIGGVFVAAIYWLIHHSSLNREELEDTQPPLK